MGLPRKSKKLVQFAGKILTNEIIHLTQEDKGFRKNKILNEAIRTDKTGYMIFIDGDCIPHPDFIKEHIENREKIPFSAAAVSRSVKNPRMN